MNLTEPWQDWLTDSLAHLRRQKLLRTLHPIVPTLNAVEARTVSGKQTATQRVML